MLVLRKFLVVAILLTFVPVAAATLTIPAPPDWWPDPYGPSDGLTRAQFHDFSADPNAGMPPDWTYDGFTPVVQDTWTLSPNLIYDIPVESHGGQDWPVMWEGYGERLNDGVGAWVADETLTKRMGNERYDYIKEIYALAIWYSPGGASLSIDVTSELPGDIVNVYQTDYVDGTWHATVLEGTIIPQPNWEDFDFVFSGPAFLDCIYIGTHCPEPTTIVLAAAGAFAALRRRK